MIMVMNFFTDIESKLRRIEEDPEGAGTTHLQKCIQGVNSLATRAFEPLFERQVCKEVVIIFNLFRFISLDIII